MTGVLADLQVPRLAGAAMGGAGARGQGQPTAARVLAEEYRVCRGAGCLRRAREQSNAQQRRAPLQAVQAGEEDQYGGGLVCRHPRHSLSYWGVRQWDVAQQLLSQRSLPLSAEVLPS